MSAVVLRGDARSLPLPDASVDLIVTSPPYWSLRDYRDGGESLASQIGSEETWQEYLANLLDCTREWVRVLKPSGSMFVVLGDKYSGAQQQTHGRQSAEASSAYWRRTDPKRSGIPEKSLMLLPERYRIACVDQLGLTARAVIEWSKPNGLPESVTDRVRRSHEDVVHITRQPRYFAAVDEIRDDYAPGTAKRYAAGYNERAIDGKRLGIGVKLGGDTYGQNPLGKLPGSVWEIASAPLFVPEHIQHGQCCDGRKQPGCEDGLDHYAAYPPALVRPIVLGWSPPGICTVCGEGRQPVVAGGRNGSGAKPHKRAQGVASFDWAAWKDSVPHTITGYACACTPYTDHPGTNGRVREGQGYARETGRDAHPHGGVGTLPRTGPWREYHFDRWAPPPTRPAVVLDPFAGTGTTMLTASVLGRVGIGIERSAGYCRLARWRTRDPGERARALGVPKPPPVPDGQASLFGEAS